MQNNNTGNGRSLDCKLVFLAGAIYETDDTPVRWKKTAARLLAKKNIKSLYPADADYGQQARIKNPKWFIQTHKNFLFTSDTILAKCEPFSIGTAMLIQLAWEWHKQIVAVTNCQSPWLLHYADLIEPTVESALDKLNYPTFDPS